MHPLKGQVVISYEPEKCFIFLAPQNVVPSPFPQVKLTTSGTTDTVTMLGIPPTTTLEAVGREVTKIEPFDSLNKV